MSEQGELCSQEEVHDSNTVLVSSNRRSSPFVCVSFRGFTSLATLNFVKDMGMGTGGYFDRET